MYIPFRLAMALSLGAILTGGCVAEKGKTDTGEKTTGLFQNWPTNADPKTVGVKVARNFLQRDYLTNKDGCIVYPEACTAFGALRFAGAVGDKELLQKLAGRYSVILTPEGQKLVSTNRHVDFRVLGMSRWKFTWRRATSVTSTPDATSPTSNGKTRCPTASRAKPAGGWTTRS